MTADILPFREPSQPNPPTSPDAERSLLGAIILHENVLHRLAPLIRAEHFSDPTHALIFDTVCKLIQSGKPVTVAALKVYLGNPDIGGITAQDYIKQCVLSASTRQGAEFEAAMVRDLYLRRQACVIARALIEQACDLPVDTPVEQMLANFENAVEELRPSRIDQHDYDLFDRSAARAVDSASTAYQRNGRLVGLSTGLTSLDDAIGGLQPSDLVVLAGRPGMGKSALAGGIAVAVARELSRKREAGERTGVVAFNSLEMGAEQLVQRILAEQSDVSSWRIRRGMASETELVNFIEAARLMRSLPLRIDETSGITIGQLALKARALQKRAGLELLVVDYIQLMSPSQRMRTRSRVDEVTEITAGLKSLAKELRVPVLALSQLSREVERREDRRPQLADLRESGSIEQDADIVMFVYREEYYRATLAEPRAGTPEHGEWEARIDEVKGQAEIIVGKNRHGPTRNVKLGYDGRLTRFLNDAPDAAPAVEKVKKRKPLIVSPKEALVGLGLLRNLTMTASLPNPGNIRTMAADAKPVSYALWRDKCAEQMLDAPDAKKASALMVKIVTPLVAADLIKRGGPKEDPLCWLTPKGIG